MQGYIWRGFLLSLAKEIKMKRIRFTGLIMILLAQWGFSYAQKTISEGTITYDITVKTGNKEPQMADALDGATTTVYLKGGFSRTDMVSALGNEKTIHDAKKGDAVLLKEYSGQKLMITLTKENWEEKNKKYEGVKFSAGTETKTISGYLCTRATATLKDGSTITVYYANELNAMNKEYDQVFKDLPGLPMEYVFETDKLRFTYTVSKIDFSPVPISRFDYPKAGYRVMTYDESKQGKKN
jgi:GLPGLI family protein